MAYTSTIPIDLRAGLSGLALRARLHDAAGAASGAAITDGFADLGNGSYLWTHAFADGFRGVARFDVPLNASIRIGSANVEPPGATPPTAAQVRAELDASSTRLAFLTGPAAVAAQIPANFSTIGITSGRFSATALENAPAGGGGGGGGDGLTLAQVKSACAEAIEDTPATLDLDQPLDDTTAGTVGGALHGAWATAWGKLTRDRLNRLLKQFGVGSQTVPAKVFALDNADAPTERIPQ